MLRTTGTAAFNPFAVMVAVWQKNYFDPMKGHFNQRTWPLYLLLV
jgi:hypothetical protein